MSCEARNRGSGEVLHRSDNVFFAVRAGCGTEQEKPEPCVGFNTTKGKACFVFCFPIPYS